MTRIALTTVLILMVAGCSWDGHEAGASVARADKTTRVNPADWGPAYVKGMENGPAEMDLSKAMHKAEQFMAEQQFADQYARRACAVRGRRTFAEVSFALLSDKTGKTRGVVRVDTKTGECSWAGTER